MDVDEVPVAVSVDSLEVEAAGHLERAMPLDACRPGVVQHCRTR